MEIMVRYERCLGCHSCEVACRVAHSTGKSLASALAVQDPPRRRIFVDQVGEGKMPFLCRHCAEAPCLDACIAGAMHRDEHGVVLNEGGRPCIGCWMCVMSCPYGMINTDARRQAAVKCDRACLDAVGKPACVAACPTRALQFTSMEEFSRERRRAGGPPA